MFLATGWRDAAFAPELGDRSSTGYGIGAGGRWTGGSSCGRCSTTGSGCTIIQNNFDTPPWRALANHEPRCDGALGSYLARLNLLFQEEAPDYVVIHDVDWLASLKGRQAWSDSRHYYYAKLPCAPRFLPDYAHNVASLIAAAAGRSRKCLVLDLDKHSVGRRDRRGRPRRHPCRAGRC